MDALRITISACLVTTLVWVLLPLGVWHFKEARRVARRERFRAWLVDRFEEGPEGQETASRYLSEQMSDPYYDYKGPWENQDEQPPQP